MIFSKCSTKLCPDDNIVLEYNHTCQRTFLSLVFFSFCSRGQRWNSGYTDERESLNWGGSYPPERWFHLYLAKSCFMASQDQQLQPDLFLMPSLTRGILDPTPADVGNIYPDIILNSKKKGSCIDLVHFKCRLLRIFSAKHNPQWKSPGSVIGHYWHCTGTGRPKTAECWWSHWHGQNQKS